MHMTAADRRSLF